jgi:hypothetical protein
MKKRFKIIIRMMIMNGSIKMTWPCLDSEGRVSLALGPSLLISFSLGHQRQKS